MQTSKYMHEFLARHSQSNDIDALCSSMISVIKEDINIENIILGQKYSRNFTWENSFDSPTKIENGR